MRLITILFMFLFAAGSAFGQNRRIQVVFVDEFGNQVDLTTSVSINIYNTGTTTNANIYTDRSGNNSITQPITDDSANTPLLYAEGRMAFYKRTPGFKIVATDGTFTRTIDNIKDLNVTIMWPSFLTEISALMNIGQLSPSGGDDMLYHDGSDWALTGLSSFMRTVLDDTSAAEARSTLGMSFGSGLYVTTVDPGGQYVSDTDMFLFEVDSTRFPNGITIEYWNISFNLDPDVELDADLKYADAWQSLANAATIDELDTAAGASSETTEANINDGNVIPAGKVIYIEFDGDPDGTGTQMIFQMGFRIE